MAAHPSRCAAECRRTAVQTHASWTVTRRRHSQTHAAAEEPQTSTEEVAETPASRLAATANVETHAAVVRRPPTAAVATAVVKSASAQLPSLDADQALERRQAEADAPDLGTLTVTARAFDPETALQIAFSLVPNLVHPAPPAQLRVARPAFQHRQTRLHLQPAVRPPPSPLPVPESAHPTYSAAVE